MRNVYVVHDRGGMDFNDAAKYGALSTIFSGHSPFDIREAYRRCLEVFSKGSEQDWVVPCGQQGLNIAAAMAFYHTWGRLNLLVFHATRREYVPQELSGLEVLKK